MTVADGSDGMDAMEQAAAAAWSGMDRRMGAPGRRTGRQEGRAGMWVGGYASRHAVTRQQACLALTGRRACGWFWRSQKKVRVYSEFDSLDWQTCQRYCQRGSCACASESSERVPSNSASAQHCRPMCL